MVVNVVHDFIVLSYAHKLGLFVVAGILRRESTYVRIDMIGLILSIVEWYPRVVALRQGDNGPKSRL